MKNESNAGHHCNKAYLDNACQSFYLKKLGYKKNKIEKFNEDLNPGLALITDWIVSSGNTALSVDMMVTNLEQMQRDDIIEIIQRGQGQYRN